MTSLLLIVIVAVVAGEIVLRRAGFDAFPLYRRDPACVYRMAPDQSGLFRGRIAWRYNGAGMRSDADYVDLSGSTVIAGDSVVDGGLQLSQADTLAERLAAATGQPVRPVACHGWALANTLGALEALPAWRKADHLVLLLNPGDLDTIGEGESTLSFPTQKPALLAPFLAARTLYRRFGARTVRQSGVTPDQREANRTRFAALGGSFAGTVTLVCLPYRGGCGRDDLVAYARSLGQDDRSIGIVDLAADPRWGDACYADIVHLTAAGTSVLAAIIADAVR